MECSAVHRTLAFLGRAALLLILSACTAAPTLSDGPSETPDANTTVEQETTVPDPAGAAYGSPCVSDEECESEICVAGVDGEYMCSEECEDECEGELFCKALGYDHPKAGSYACMQGSLENCAPCANDNMCGGKLDRCQVVGAEGNKYCTGHCETDDDCPMHYACEEAGSTTSRVCLPSTGSCVCNSEVLDTYRPCEISNDHGTCSGEEKCEGSVGWAGCTAATPEAEICDGLDNDCNTSVDEGFPDNDSDTIADCVDEDDDDDGVLDTDDNCPLVANAEQTDTDGNGEGDACVDDKDGDGVLDGQDTCPLVANADQADNDEDGLGDICDFDDDNDGVDDVDDNCPLLGGDDLTDTDGDGLGDICDDDDDGDGVLDTDDNCGLLAGDDLTDTDGDGLGDICDDDDDNDGVADEDDTCQLLGNEDQTDSDEDGLGDSCDPDDDNDGIEDAIDLCVFTPNAGQEDADGDGLGDVCDDDDDNDGQPDTEDCEPLVSGISGAATEICDGIDNNCDGTVDEPGADGCFFLYQDGDGDGFGAGIPSCLCEVTDLWTAVAAADCEDDNPEVKPGAIETCDNVDQDCDGVTDEDLTQVCVPSGYNGLETFWDVGDCSRGTAACVAGDWGECADAIGPTPDLCDDGQDNDCNGVADDAVACASDCDGDLCDFSIGGGGDGDNGDTEGEDPVFNQPETEDEIEDCIYDCGYNVGVNDEGYLYLDLTINVVNVPYVWVANDGDQTITKIDSITARETARYQVGPECSSPSRTAVNETGAVWVGCRGNNRVVLIAPDEGQCIDRNGNGVIDTSTVIYDENGNKTVNSLPWQEDECVLFNGTPEPAADAPQDTKNNPISAAGCDIGIRGVAVRASGSLIFAGLSGCWAGHIYEATYTYDPEAPYEEGVNPRVELTDHWHAQSLEHTDWNGEGCSFDYDAGAYGFAIDQKGDLWVSSITSHIAWVDLKERRSCSFPSPSTYGMAVDYAGRVWYGDWSGGYGVAQVFIPETKSFFTVTQRMDGSPWESGTNLPGGQYTRGVSASPNPDKPHVYLNLSNGATGAVRVKVVNEDPNNFDARVEGIIRTDGNAICATAGQGCGISLDGEGDLWVVHMNACGNSQVMGRDFSTAVSVELDPDAVIGWHNPGSAAEANPYVKSIVGQGSSTYTYSDFMGYQFATIVNPTGFYVQRFTGWGAVDGAQSTEWVKMVVEVMEQDTDLPLYLSYRAADTPEALAAEGYSQAVQMTCADGNCVVAPENPPTGVYLDMKLTLKKNDEGASVTIKELKASGKKKAL